MEKVSQNQLLNIFVKVWLLALGKAQDALVDASAVMKAAEALTWDLDLGPIRFVASYYGVEVEGVEAFRPRFEVVLKGVSLTDPSAVCRAGVDLDRLCMIMESPEAVPTITPEQFVKDCKAIKDALETAAFQASEGEGELDDAWIERRAFALLLEGIV